MEAGRGMVLIDSRAVGTYRTGHIPGARSIPLDALQRRLGELPRQEMVVLYSDGDDIDFIYWFLRERGFRNVTVLQDGFRAWLDHGYPVER
jgi:rhodanese-related sulfurtransferase